MVANIFADKFVSVREVPWHRIGQVLDEPVTATEAVKRTGMDYKIEVVPTYFKWGGEMIEAAERRAIVREPVPGDPQPAFLGFAGSKYTVVQNAELAQMLEQLTAEWPVETVGALGLGETIFFTLAVGGGEIAGDEIKEYFVVSDTRDGKHALRIMYTPVRVVCQNTLISAMAASTLSEAVTHHKNQKEEVQFQIGLMAKMKRSRDLVNQALTQMSEKPLSNEEITDIIAQTYPFMKVPAKVLKQQELQNEGVLTEAEIANLEKIRAKFGNEINGIRNKRNTVEALLARFNDEYPKVANTAWAVYNVIAERADHALGNTDTDEGLANTARSALFGPRAAEKQTAFALCATAAGVNMSAPVVEIPEKKTKAAKAAAAKAEQPTSKKKSVVFKAAPVAAGADFDALNDEGENEVGGDSEE